MEIHYHPTALRELKKLDKSVQKKFRVVFEALVNETPLPSRIKKDLIGTVLHEYRVKHVGNEYRCLASSLKPGIVMLLFFQKKTQKTPIRYLDTATKRLKNI